MIIVCILVAGRPVTKYICREGMLSFAVTYTQSVATGILAPSVVYTFTPVSRQHLWYRQHPAMAEAKPDLKVEDQNYPPGNHPQPDPKNVQELTNHVSSHARVATLLFRL